MKKDQRGRPSAQPNLDDDIVESEDVPTYMVSVSHNGKRLEWLNRMLQPFGRFVFAFLAWRQKHRRGSNARTSSR